MNITFKCIPFKAFSLEELYDVMAFRQKVFVVEQDCPYLDADGLDLIAYHVLGITKNKIIAYARLLPKGAVFDNYTLIGSVVTDNSVRNKGVGSKLMTESIHQIEQLFGCNFQLYSN